MSWIQELIKTYDAFEEQAGIVDEMNKTLLEPIGHMIGTAHIEVCLTRDTTGKVRLVTAKALEKVMASKNKESTWNDNLTLIPCTPQSSSRTAGIAPHPLADKLEYIARDYHAYMGLKENEAYDAYIKQLRKWAESPEGKEIEPLQIVYEYVRDHDIIAELVEAGVLFLKEGKIMDKWTGEGKPPIFCTDVLPSKSLVRFMIIQEGVINWLWKDKTLQNSYIQYYTRTLREEAKDKGEEDYCYATGEKDYITPFHGKYLRNRGDGAKIISGQERSDKLKYSGRFTTAQEVAGISYENSQKSMNALRWLISKQGYTQNGKVFLIWSHSDRWQNLSTTKPIVGDSFSFDCFAAETEEPSTQERVALTYKQWLLGEKTIDTHSLEEKINILITDAATPGRLAIEFYDEYPVNDYLNRLLLWHHRSLWPLYQHRKEEILYTRIGIPSIKSILYNTYGQKVNEKVGKNALLRLFMSIINGQRVPYDIVQLLISRTIRTASQAYGRAKEMDRKTWLYLLEVTCSMIKNYTSNQKGEGCAMALDTTCKDRSYLFGRLLAWADDIERQAMEYQLERPTNAMQYMAAMNQRPSTTWQTIYMKLIPYLNKLAKVGEYRKQELDKITDLFAMEDFTNNNKLEATFLLGYSCQRRAIENNRNKNKNKDNEKGANA